MERPSHVRSNYVMQVRPLSSEGPLQHITISSLVLYILCLMDARKGASVPLFYTYPTGSRPNLTDSPFLTKRGSNTERKNGLQTSSSRAFESRKRNRNVENGFSCNYIPKKGFM